MSHFIGNERCPSCAKMGNDRSGNNLAIYSDGHKYCFACGYYEKGDIVERYKFQQEPKKPSKFFNRALSFNDKALIYLKKYGLTNQEIDDNYFWDDSGFMVFDGDEFQNARNFTGMGAKYITRGIIKGNEKIFANGEDWVVIVEDAISAIKVSRVVSSVAIHNSIIPLELILRLAKRFSNLAIWLDPDKQKEVLREANKASIHFEKVNVIWADKDPKDFSTQDILNKLLAKGVKV
jgi:hypothetical protein